MTNLKEIKKVTIEANGKKGELISEFDGRWGVVIDGQNGGCLYYTDAQVEKIMATKEHTVEYK